MPGQQSVFIFGMFNLTILNMRKHLLLLLLPLVFALGCNKDDDEKTPPHKIVGTWRVTKVETRLSGQDWQNTDEICRLDNTEEYKANGAWTQYDGTDQCGAGTGITNGTWKLAASDTKVIYTYNGVPGEYESTVEQLTGTTMVLSFSTGATDGEHTRPTYQTQ